MTRHPMAKWLAGGAVAAAVWFGAAWAGDLWTRLGMTETQAREAAPNALVHRIVPYSMAAKSVMAVPPEARAVLVTEALAWAKTYAASAEFEAAYAALREARKPARPPSAAEQEQQARAEQEEQRRQLEEAKNNLAQLSPELRAQMEAALKETEALSQQMASDPQMAVLMQQAQAAEARSRQDSYQEELAQWEKDYPADVSLMIARRLGEFLALSAQVDYSAKLVPRGTKMAFADEGFESQSLEWKLCYRAGRQTVEAARAFAAAWLAEFEKR
jgi:hypothetical protein